MCGIYLSLNPEEPDAPGSRFSQLLRRRGPDSFQVVEYQVQSHGPCSPSNIQETVFITFAASVLSLRGHQLTPQPVSKAHAASLLCWNGEAWRIADTCVAGNDAEIVFALLANAALCDGLNVVNGRCSNVCRAADCLASSLTRVAQAISSIAGPYAFVFFDEFHQRVIFGRDPLGRRSLLRRRTHAGGLIIASVSDRDNLQDWEEVEADGVYVVDLFLPSRFVNSKITGVDHGYFPESRFEVTHIPSVSINNHSWEAKQ